VLGTTKAHYSARPDDQMPFTYGFNDMLKKSIHPVTDATLECLELFG
jgi:hypothetical protein